MIDWTDPFPYEFSPSIIALLWSFKAPARISAADAEPLLIKTSIGSESYSQTDKIKTTNVNILLNRVRLDKKKTLKKRIIFSVILISLVSSLAIYFIV